MLSKLEGLIQAIETFFHPSNSGNWTKPISQLVYFLADFIVMRWNREQSGEYELPEDRKLTPELRRRFELCLRDVTFMGIYAKSGLLSLGEGSRSAAYAGIIWDSWTVVTLISEAAFTPA